MVKDEYKVESDLVEITYSLPESMLQHMAPDTPPMHVTNDRQVQNLIELSRAHVIRLCVSIRLEMDCDVNNDCDGILDSDYSVYGKVKDEDQDDITFDGVGGSQRCLGEGARSKSTWSDGIFVGQSFSRKDELLRELRLTAMMSRFAFKTYKSTKTLLVATCRVKGCKWKVRACDK
ncbi:unnamed protein product [Arabis nemorensis]|uniref:Transposase MuDR plant domain-containing protein n=1 Tax=Arabis nemorensis TaxID=586526 RepID=A0A565ATT2_9BRAS|nr:unnamed protein product [Arabis nemorensis]